MGNRNSKKSSGARPNKNPANKIGVSRSGKRIYGCGGKIKKK